MRQWILIIVFASCFCVNPVAAQTQEYAILRTEYLLQKGGFVCRLHLEVGDEQSALHGLVINDGGALVIGRGAESKRYLTDVSALNALSKLGWKIHSMSVIKISVNDYNQYLLVREN
jgi:hypothetical protein